MNKKILILGIMLFLIGGAGWFMGVIFSAITLGAFRMFANVSALISLIGFALIIFNTTHRLLKNKHYGKRTL